MRAEITQGCGATRASLAASLVGLAVVLATAGFAQGAIVPVVNASFESPVTLTFNAGDITGWVGTGEYGVFRPAAFPSAYGGTGTTDGDQVAYSNGGTISQVLTTLLAGETVYTLTVDVGNRLDLTFPGYAVELYAGGNLLASANSPTAPDGTYVPVVVQYISSPTDPNIGEELEIRLVSSGVQTNFDNVVLDATPTPEPSTLAVLGLGAIGLAAAGWRRRKQSA